MERRAAEDAGMLSSGPPPRKGVVQTEAVWESMASWQRGHHGNQYPGLSLTPQVLAFPVGERCRHGLGAGLGDAQIRPV